MSNTFAEELHNEQIEWPIGLNTYFIPRDVLDRLITEESVKIQLSSDFPHMVGDRKSTCATSICRRAKKLYGLLLRRRLPNLICPLLDEGVSDHDLPFVRCYNLGDPKKFTLCKKSHDGSRSLDHGSCGIKAFSALPHIEIQKLSRDQWVFQAPVFEKTANTIPHLELDNNIIMPFIEDMSGEETNSEGGYGRVWGVRLHAAHQYLYTSEDVDQPLLAIKRLFSRNYNDFKKERDMLSALDVRRDRHLIKLLATYKFQNGYHLVFPHANANLRGYWNDTGRPHWNRETYSWFLNQICGLASGLNTIHNFDAKLPLGTEPANKTLRVPSGGQLRVETAEAKYGRHGDIKPENILWSSELPDAGTAGILQIADMGLGRFHGLDSRSRVDPRGLSGSPTYSPPEIALGRAVSRAYDMWSLGCVFLEFITWLIEGSSRIYDFSSHRGKTGEDGINDDMFFTVVTLNGTKSAVVRESVVTWMKDLEKSPRCSKMVLDLLQIVQQHLLVVESRSRIRSEGLVAKLNTIVQKSEADATYLLGSDPPSQELHLGVKLPKGPNTKSSSRVGHGHGQGDQLEQQSESTTRQPHLNPPTIHVDEFNGVES